MLHPLSLFPSLLSYPFLAYMILRLVVAYAILSIGFKRWKKVYKYLAIADILAGVLVLIGLYTQGALILVILLLIKEYYLESKAGALDKNLKMLLSVVFIVALALMFLGPGAFALDYPL